MQTKQVLPGGLLVLWQIGFQLLYGLLDDVIAAELRLSLNEQAWLGLTFLVPYAAMQWWAGRLIDRWGAQRILAIAALGCAVGAGLFASAASLHIALTGRLVTGMAAAFAFPSVAQLLRLKCSGRQFSLSMAVLESCIGFGSAAVAFVLLWAPQLSWRSVCMIEAMLGFTLSVWMAPECYRAWRDGVPSSEPEQTPREELRRPVKWSVVLAASGVYAWEAGMVFAFGGFWSLWLERQRMLSTQAVTLSSLLMFLAVGTGTAAFGVLAKSRRQRCSTMLIGTTIGGVVLMSLLQLTVVEQGNFHLPAMILFGFSTAVGGLAFGEAGLAADPGKVAQVIGLVNGIGCLAGGAFHVLPTSAMVRMGVESNLLVWFGLLALVGWCSALLLWSASRSSAITMSLS